MRGKIACLYFQAARSPFEEMLASDKEDKPSDDDLKTKPFPKRNSRSYSADLERKSADTPLDQKKIRKREKVSSSAFS